MPSTRAATLLRKLTDRARMIDPAAAPVHNETTHEVTRADGATLWEGPALFQDAASSRQTVDGAEVRQLAEIVVRVPSSALEYLVAGCIVERPSDGLRLQVIRVPARTNSVTCRLECKRWSDAVDLVRSRP